MTVTATLNGVTSGALSVTVSGTCNQTAILVNEVLTGTASSATNECVELYNPCTTQVTIPSGWTLQYRKDNGTSDTLLHTFTAAKTVAGLGFFVVGSSGYPAAGKDDTYNGGASISATGGGVALKTGTTYYGQMGWGTATNIFVQGNAAPASGDVNGSTGYSSSRCPNGSLGAGNNSVDFVANRTPTPKAANNCP